MEFRFTLTHLISFPPFSEWEAESGSWTIDNTPSVTTSSPASIVIDYPLIPGTYELAYDVSVTGAGAGAWFLNFRFEKDTGATLLQESSIGNGSPSNETGTIQFTLTDTSTSIEIQFAPTGTRALTINSLVPSMDGVEISQPDGWKGSKIILERDPDFCSLVERYEGSAGGAFIFYGENGEEDGGIELIKDIEESYGLDADITILAEYASDGVNYDEIFEGLMELTGKNEMKDNKMQVPVITNDLWSKFWSRRDTPVNLSDLVDLDGNTVDPVIPITVNLTSQKVRYNGEYTWEESVWYPNPSGDGTIQIDWDTTVIDDLKKFNLPRIDVTTVPFNLIAGLFEAPHDGLYNFDIRIESGSYFGATWQNALANPRFRIGKTGAGVDEVDYMAMTSVSINNAGQYLWVHTFVGSFLLSKGQQITMFGRTDSSAGTTTIFGERLNDWKTDAHVASTIALTLSGTQTIDNYAAIATNRVLVKNQGDPKENGIWIVAAGAWARAADSNTSAELQDATVYIINGDTNANTYWIQDTEDVVLGTTAITFRTTIYNDTKLLAYPGTGTPDNHIIVTADTTFKETTAQGYLIHDLIHGVLTRMGLGTNPFYSEFLGSTLTNSRVYALDGCGWMYAIIKGLQLRQYTLTEKPFFISFKQIWDGINPILNLGLGYDSSGNISNGDFINTLLPSFNSGSGNSWNWVSNKAKVILPNNFAPTKRLLMPISIIAGVDYTFNLNFDMIDGGGGAGSSTELNLYLTDNVDFSNFSSNDNLPLGLDQTLVVNITATQNWPYIMIILTAENSTSFARIFDLDSIVKVSPEVSVKQIRIEEKTHFFDDTVAVNFSNVREISASYDQDMIFKTIKTGFKVWESEDISGNDDPQTKHTYATRFKKVGKEINLESEFIAAGVATETARRTTREKSADYKHDNNNFIIALNETPISADVYVPELDENFDSVIGLLNSDSRYNLVLTPMRSLLRWITYLNGCLQSYPLSKYKFVSGEGNYDMVSDYSCASGNFCQAKSCDSRSEKMDINVNDDDFVDGYLHLPLLYDIVIPMELEEFQAIDRKKAIGISQTDTGHVAFKIKLLEYEINKGEAVIKAWPKTPFPINVINEYNQSTCD